MRLVVFPGGFNWPVWVAQERSFFARRGVEVDVMLTPGSVHQWTSLAKGEADVAITLMDNVIAYREGQGEAPLTVPDAVAIMAFDNRTMPSLVTSPSITRFADLCGATLAVDAAKTGNAIVLMGMLERMGLAPDEYRLARAGGVAQRYEAVLRGEYAGALFNSPFDRMLREKGFHVLGSAQSLLERFQAHVVAVRERWAERHREAVVHFLRALQDALAWLYEPAHLGDAYAIYMRGMPGTSVHEAEMAYEVLFDPGTGFPVDGAFDIGGVREVISLRERFGEPRKMLGSVDDYCNVSFLMEAAVR